MIRKKAYEIVENPINIRKKAYEIVENPINILTNTINP